MIMKYGKIDNTERKFISSNITYLNKYLENLLKIEDVIIFQFFNNGYKYRKYITKNGNQYTKNLKINNITDVIKITELEFNKTLELSKNVICKRRRTYLDGDYQIDVDDFKEPKEFTMVEVSNGDLDNYNIPKGLIDVTNIIGYQNKEISQGFIKKTGVILEGCDAVGKSETIKRLLQEGIICKDRELAIISRYMLFDVPMTVRVQKYIEFLQTTNDILIFLVNNNKKELLRRVHLRSVISDFDLNTYEYNKLYQETYEYMKNNDMLQDKLYLIDCTGVDLENQVQKVKKVINKYAKY